jgi:ribosome maturation factor RimP
MTVRRVRAVVAGDAEREMGLRAHFLFVGQAITKFAAMTAKRQELMALVEPVVNAMGYELCDLELRIGRGRGLLRLFIDDEQGVNLMDCEAVSRQVSGVLDVEDPIVGQYSLEVSSPGMDRRLVKPAHFDRFAGSDVDVRLRRLIEGRRHVTGRLLGRDGDVITIGAGAVQVRIPLAEIESARLVPDLSVPKRDRRTW